jgi:hypothetical protein
MREAAVASEGVQKNPRAKPATRVPRLSILDAPPFITLLADCIHAETETVPKSIAARIAAEDKGSRTSVKQTVARIPEKMIIGLDNPTGRGARFPI